MAHVNVVPLALSDEFEFTKVNKFLNDPRFQPKTDDRVIQFERARANYGAIMAADLFERRGHYFTVWWTAKRDADITVRLEYRQENLGSRVQAKEVRVPTAGGPNVTKFTVIGDEYLEGGKITSWRLLLIENGRAVGLHQSFLWN